MPIFKPTQALWCASMLLLTSLAHGQDDLKQYAQSWTGLFGQQKIGVFIEKITPMAIQGYSVVGHNIRPFQGVVRAENHRYTITAQEPMTEPSDGTFTFILDPQFPQQINGSWQSQHPSVEGKSFRLVKRQCEAGRRAGEYAASQRALTGDELQTSAWELSIMRNEIYARHGYSFANSDMAAYFAEQDWYIPCQKNVAKQLTTLEKQNIKKLEKAEKYAKAADWGR